MEWAGHQGTEKGLGKKEFSTRNFKEKRQK